MTPSQIAGFATWLIGQAGALTDIVTSADDQQFLANYTEGLRRIADNGLSIPEAQRGACQALTEIAFMALVEAGKGTPGADTIVGNIHSTTSALLAARPAETDEDARRRKTRGGLSLAGGVLLLGLGILLVRRRG